MLTFIVPAHNGRRSEGGSEADSLFVTGVFHHLSGEAALTRDGSHERWKDYITALIAKINSVWDTETPLFECPFSFNSRIVDVTRAIPLIVGFR